MTTKCNVVIWKHITERTLQNNSVQFSHSVLSNSQRPMDCSTPGLPVHHQLPEFTPTHLYCIGDAIQPSHPLSSPSPHTFNLSQHQCLFNASVLRIRWPKDWSFSFSISPSKNIQVWSSLGWTGWIRWQSRTLSRVFSNTTVQKHQFFGAQFSLQSKFDINTGKIIALTRRTFVGKVMSLLFNMLSRLVITFLSRSKHLLIQMKNSIQIMINELP